MKRIRLLSSTGLVAAVATVVGLFALGVPPAAASFNPPSFQKAFVWKAERNTSAGANEMVFKFTGTASGVVHYKTVPETAGQGSQCSGSADYIGKSGAASAATVGKGLIIRVPICDDNVGEDNESFAVQLTDPSGGVFTAQALILDDDPGKLTVIGEPAFSGSPVVFRIVLSRPYGHDVSVHFKTADGCGGVISCSGGLPATAPGNYTARQGLAKFPANHGVVPYATVSVQTKADCSLRFFRLLLSGAVGAPIAPPGVARGTMLSTPC